MRVIVVGAGIFGASAALELATRGHRVVLVDQAPPPTPDAASTDLSKLIRADYGADRFYATLMIRALAGWHAWNDRFTRPAFHATGLRVLARDWSEGGFEHDSYAALSALGQPVSRFDVAPAPWSGGLGGYVSEAAGWAESGFATAEVVRLAIEAGVELRVVAVTAIGPGPRVEPGLVADAVVVAAGAWTPILLPELADRLWAVGQPVLHFRPPDPAAWAPPRWLPWAADIARTGFYGFPTADGVVKIANHGVGAPTDPRGPRVVDPRWEPRFRDWLARFIPPLADAPVVRSRLCLYCDSFDGDFFIDAVPDRPGVFVASGGSGHGFKFGPVLGPLVADVVEGGRPPDRFGWRHRGRPATEAARSGVDLG